MRKRSSKQGKMDLNKLAADIVSQSTGDHETDDTRNPAAVTLGRLGGLKGGKARAASLSPKERRDIAKKAAAVRWKKET